MKANEAPEKIYLYPSDRAGEEYEAEWGDRPWGEDCVEYTRTDAFIKKACKWLEDNLLEYWGQKNAVPDGFIEDFRNYLKGK